MKKLLLIDAERQLYESPYSLADIAGGMMNLTNAANTLKGKTRTTVPNALRISALLGVDKLFFLAPLYYDVEGNPLPEHLVGVPREIYYGKKRKA